jgi:acyl transferase domain-containing protein
MSTFPPIAVVGLSCRLPAGMSSPDRFWTALLDGLDAVGEVPPGRCGQGGQWPRMGVDLMARDPGFREAMEEIDALFAARAGWSLLDEIRRPAEGSRIARTEIVQPSIMAIQIALGRVLRDRGVEVHAVTGHSIGEVAAAWFAGALTLEEAVDVVHGRSVIQATAAGGSLLATGLDEDALEAELRRHPERGSHLGGDYWYRNVRAPVRFRAAVDAMLDEGVTTFLEVGPHPVVTRGAARTIEVREAAAIVLPTMDRGTAPDARLAVVLGALAVRGHALDEARLWGAAPRPVPLPAYAWQRRPYRDEAPAERATRLSRRPHPWLRSRRGLVTAPDARVFEAHVALDATPWLDDHRVDGAVVVPGTAHIELALAAAREAAGHDRVEIADVRFEQALVVPERGAAPLDVRLEVRSADGDYALLSRPSDDGDAPWASHSRGRIRAATEGAPAPALDALLARFEGATGPSAEVFYAAIEAMMFSGLRSRWTMPRSWA